MAPNHASPRNAALAAACQHEGASPSPRKPPKCLYYLQERKGAPILSLRTPEHPWSIPRCPRAAVSGCWPGTSRYCPLAAPGPGRERTVPGDARGALRGPRGVPGDTAPAAGTASPRLGWAVPRTPGRRARLKWVCFGVFFYFSLDFFWEMHLARSPRARRMRLCLSPGCFPSRGVVFPQAGNLRLEICDNNWNGESVSECTPA